MSELISKFVTLIFFALYCWAIWLGVRNLKQVGRSPHLMWFSLICCPVSFFLIIWSFYLVKQKKTLDRLQQIKEEEQRRKEEEDRPKREAENRKRAAEQHEVQQRSLALRLTSLISDSNQIVARLPNLVRDAENTIDRAEREFRERAYTPFWEVVEQAAEKLAYFEAEIQSLIQTSKSYKEQALQLDTAPPLFQIGIHTLPDASHTVSRLRSVVRQAQKDFQFATIYKQCEMIDEQRKTNHLLAAGFSRLGQAIDGLGDRLDSSMAKLAYSVHMDISDLTSKVESEHGKTRKQAASDSADQRKISKDQRESQNEANEMLDNIQRRRKPNLPGIDDGAY